MARAPLTHRSHHGKELRTADVTSATADRQKALQQRTLDDDFQGARASSAEHSSALNYIGSTSLGNWINIDPHTADIAHAGSDDTSVSKLQDSDTPGQKMPITPPDSAQYQGSSETGDSPKSTSPSQGKKPDAASLDELLHARGLISDASSNEVQDQADDSLPPLSLLEAQTEEPASKAGFEGAGNPTIMDDRVSLCLPNSVKEELSPDHSPTDQVTTSEPLKELWLDLDKKSNVSAPLTDLLTPRDAQQVQPCTILDRLFAPGIHDQPFESADSPQEARQDSPREMAVSSEPASLAANTDDSSPEAQDSLAGEDSHFIADTGEQGILESSDIGAQGTHGGAGLTKQTKGGIVFLDHESKSVNTDALQLSAEDQPGTTRTPEVLASGSKQPLVIPF